MDECSFKIAQANENVGIVMYINYSKNNFRHSRPICQNAKKERKKKKAFTVDDVTTSFFFVYYFFNVAMMKLDSSKS